MQCPLWTGAAGKAWGYDSLVQDAHVVAPRTVGILTCEEIAALEPVDRVHAGEALLVVDMAVRRHHIKGWGQAGDFSKVFKKAL